MFYSIWALLIHLLFLLNIIDSTFTVALYVFIFGTLIILFNYWKYPEFFFNANYKYHLIAHAIHILPLFLFWNKKNQDLNWNILFISLIIYFIVSYILGLNPIYIYYNVPKYISR